MVHDRNCKVRMVGLFLLRSILAVTRAFKHLKAAKFNYKLKIGSIYILLAISSNIGKQLNKEMSKPAVFPLDLFNQVMHKCDKIILYGRLCHAGCWRLRTFTKSLGTSTQVCLVDPCLSVEKINYPGKIDRPFIHLLFYPLLLYLLISPSTPSAHYLHSLFFSSYIFFLAIAMNHIFSLISVLNPQITSLSKSYIHSFF